MSTKKTSVGAADMATAFAGLPKGTVLKAGDKLPVGAGGIQVSVSEDGSNEPDWPPHERFTLPSVSSTFDWDEEDKTFGVAELKPHQERKAMELGGKSPMQIQTEMVRLSIVRIGNRKPTYQEVERWQEVIGPKARRMVDLAFNTVNFMSDDEGEAFLATKVSVRK